MSKVRQLTLEELDKIIYKIVDRKTGKISIINKEQIEIFLKKEYEF